MENKAMYLSTYEERESGSMYEDAYDGHNLSKLNLCDEGKKTSFIKGAHWFNLIFIWRKHGGGLNGHTHTHTGAAVHS